MKINSNSNVRQSLLQFLVKLLMLLCQTITYAKASCILKGHVENLLNR